VGSLTGVDLKIERAEKHIAEFEAAQKTFIEDADTYVIRPQEDPVSGDLVHRVFIDADREAAGLQRLAVIAGDAIHNLRCALDYLAFQLVESGGGKTHAGTMFTVFKNAQSSWRSRDGAGIHGADPNAIFLWKRMKPYAGGNPRLWALHRLDILDKHQLLLAVNTKPSHVGVQNRWMARQIRLFYPKTTGRERLVDGAEVYRVTAADRGSPENETDPQFFFDVAFGETEVFAGKLIFASLIELRDFVRRVEAAFAQYVYPDIDLTP
jgi:hypothetical protein